MCGLIIHFIFSLNSINSVSATVAEDSIPAEDSTPDEDYMSMPFEFTPDDFDPDYTSSLNGTSQDDDDDDDQWFIANNDAVYDDYVIDAIITLPENLKPQFGFRCGYNEVDARSNCKSQCTHSNDCNDGEQCWGIQLNYCNTFEEGSHPVCTNLDMADNGLRCGYDETSARGHCGVRCSTDLECGNGERCYPTLLNLCDCYEVEQTEEYTPEESEIVFAQAKALLTPYFVAKDPSSTATDTKEAANAEIPESSSNHVAPRCMVAGIGLFVAFSMFIA